MTFSLKNYGKLGSRSSCDERRPLTQAIIITYAAETGQAPGGESPLVWMMFLYVARLFPIVQHFPRSLEH